MEPIIKPKPVPIPNRRKTIRRQEDIWKLRHGEALDALVPEMAYDIKNILMLVHWHMQGLREEVSKIEETSAQERQAFRQRWSDRLEQVSDVAKRFIDRMNQVRLYTQASQCPIETVVAGVIENSCKIAEKEGISLRCQGLANLPTVFAYEWRLRAVFFSVISRAIQVSQPGGSITVSGRVDQAQGTAIIEVQDTGLVIALPLCDAFNSGEELNVTEQTKGFNAWHIFDFQQARKIAETHGGRISIESSEGAGTICLISFPVT